jgi:hypothetical protein
MDWYVLLTPILALAVIGLLGFTGCDQLFGLNEVEPPPPTTMLTFEARLPSHLTVLASEFKWLPPGAVNSEVSPPPVMTTDGTDTVLTHVITTTVGGTWMMVTCTLRVEDTVEKGLSTNMDGMFVLDPPADPEVTARVYTTGRPDTKDFRVFFAGREPL